MALANETLFPLSFSPYVNLGIDSLFKCLGYSCLVCCQNPQFMVLVTRSGSMNIMGNLYIAHNTQKYLFLHEKAYNKKHKRATEMQFIY